MEGGAYPAPKRPLVGFWVEDTELCLETGMLPDQTAIDLEGWHEGGLNRESVEPWNLSTDLVVCIEGGLARIVLLHTTR